MKAKRKYFSGLNALRFLAAFLVIFNHIEQYQFWAGWSNIWGHSVINQLGHLPVSFFFVLSGFLITYLLLTEIDNSGSIDLSHFYWKRFIRIWPVYLLVALVALFIVPEFQDASFGSLPSPNRPVVYFSIFSFMPNILRISFPTLIGGNQLWSVGVEEQFYLFWPLLLMLFRRRILVFLIGFAFCKILIQITLIAMEVPDAALWFKQLVQLYVLFPVEQMAIGGIGAWIWFKESEHCKRVIANPFLLLFTVLVVYSLFDKLETLGLISLTQGIIFMQFIALVITSKKVHRLLDNRLLSYLGEISYGIYMWHTLIIFFVISILKAIGVDSHWSLYMITPVLTLVVAHVSYQLLEKPILAFRNVKINNLIPLRKKYASL